LKGHHYVIKELVKFFFDSYFSYFSLFQHIRHRNNLANNTEGEGCKIDHGYYEILAYEGDNLEK